MAPLNRLIVQAIVPYLYVCVFHGLQRLKCGDSTKAFQPLRDVRNVKPSGPKKNRSTKEVRKWGDKTSGIFPREIKPLEF